MNLFKKLRSMKLLLIDDDVWIRDALKLFFECEGCHIIALETAEEGLAFVKDQKFDLIIADYRLPGMNGLEFIRQLPANQAKAFKILITAYGSKDVFSEAHRIGVHDCIPKPFTSKTIEASLEHMISKS